MALVPVGVPGEIYIAGPGLARGYIRQPRLTAECFVPSPFGDGQRLYRTGDRARWRHDGSIEFLDRYDRQVKIRGHRIECGEVEQAILSGIKTVTKVAVEGRVINGERELVAYIETANAIAAADVRERLGSVLPQYMVPARFVTFERLPLLPSGKIDRAALPDPRGLEAETGADYAPPVTDVECEIAAAWSHVLGRRTGLRDNFFDLGGDSIKAIQVIARLHQAGWSSQLRDIFVHPTIAQLAPHVKRVRHEVDQRAVTGDVPLTPIQRWFFKEMPSTRAHFNQAVLLVARERIDVASLQKAFEIVMAHHDVLRSVFAGTTDEPRQAITARTPFELQISETIPPTRSFDLEHGPLLRAVLLRGSGDDRVFIEVHHLVIDGVSWRILLEDLTEAYHQAAQGRSTLLPKKTESFKAWAEALTRAADAPSLLDEYGYWTAVLSAAARLAAPVGSAAMTETRTASFQLGSAETEQLLRHVHRAYNTAIDDVLLTALSRALGKAFGGGRRVVYLEHHGRQAIEVDVSRTIGWFTTIYPFVLETGAAADIGEQIRSIKEAIRQVPRNGAGFGELKSTVAGGRSMNRTRESASTISVSSTATYRADCSALSMSRR